MTATTLARTLVLLVRHPPLLVVATLALALLAPAGALGQTGKLPKTVVPIHYAIELEPDLERLTLSGAVAIDIEVREPTARILLNAEEMTLASATIGNGTQRAEIALDTDTNIATFTFPQPISAGRHQLRIAYTGKIGRRGGGLYVVDYATDKGTRRMLSSHFAPADARRAFPCWDEPAFKATFALTVTVPRAQVVVSNMPIATEEPVTPTLKQVAFQPTPKMSSYLLTLTVGELERISGDADGVAVNVFTTGGKRAQGRYALDSAIKLLRYFNDYFGLKYDLPKLDLIAVPQGYVNAMEHWGAVTFRENRLLLDPATSTATTRRRIFELIAHEFAHQWFGNLVTMAWWDDLWLNEGFATWMENKATDHFHPQWQTWLNSNDEKQSIMRRDAQAGSRAIRRPVANESDASAMFDGFTYNKAAAVVRMLESYVGEDAFRAGLRRYLADHSHGSATTADLWRALENASGKPVGAVGATFVDQPGFPLVIAETRCTGDQQRLVLRQEPFALRNGDAVPRRWRVPIAIGPLAASRPAETVVLDQDSQEVPAGRCSEPIKLNLGDVGYYRVAYDDAERAALTRAFALLAPIDRVNMLSDNWALIEVGRAPTASYFELVDEVSANDSRAAWDQVMRTVARLDRLQRGRPDRAAFQIYARAKLNPVLARLTWDEPRPNTEGSAVLRAQLIRTLGELGDAHVLAEAQRRFAAFVGDPASLRRALREPVIYVAGIGADRATYDTLLSLARKATNASERASYYTAAAGARDPALAKATLELTLTDELSADLVGSVINAVAVTGDQADLAWTFLQQNYETLAAKQGAWFRNNFVASFMRVFSDWTRAAELAGFAPAHATSGGRAAAQRAQEAIIFDADVKTRVLPALDAWLRRRARE